jgi:hypothetical protein
LLRTPKEKRSILPPPFLAFLQVSIVGCLLIIWCYAHRDSRQPSWPHLADASTAGAAAIQRQSTGCSNFFGGGIIATTIGKEGWWKYHSNVSCKNVRFEMASEMQQPAVLANAQCVINANEHMHDLTGGLLHARSKQAERQ